jgi:WD40 repeat protein
MAASSGYGHDGGGGGQHQHAAGFKAHEFVAHGTRVTCVVIGPRSGAVLATGGEDKRVNVWKVQSTLTFTSYGGT